MGNVSESIGAVVIDALSLFCSLSSAVKLSFAKKFYELCVLQCYMQQKSFQWLLSWLLHK